MGIIGIIVILALACGIGLFAGWAAVKLWQAQEYAREKLRDSWYEY